jgi:hypothetical protein
MCRTMRCCMVALNPQGKGFEGLDMDSQFVASNFGISVRTQPIYSV